MIIIINGATQISIESFRRIEGTHSCFMEVTNEKIPIGTINFAECYLKFMFENNENKFYEEIKKDKQYKESNGK